MSHDASYTPHQFNPKIAELYSVPAALIYQYLAYRSRNASGWVRLTLSDVLAQYPYLCAWQVWAALQKLIHSGSKTPALILRKRVNGHFLYRPVAVDDLHCAPHVFDARIAAQHGIIAAVLYHNLSFWIKNNWQEKAEWLLKELDPEEFEHDDAAMLRCAYYKTREWARHDETAEAWLARHPYTSLRTVWRAFSALAQADLLQKYSARHESARWRMGRAEMVSFERELLRKSNLEISSARTQKPVPKPKTQCQNPKATAKTQTEPQLTRVPATASKSLYEAFIVEAPFEKPVKESSANPPQPSTLAPARVSREADCSPDRALRFLHEQEKPVQRRTLKTQSALGHPARRAYVRHYTPMDSRYDLAVLEDMTEPERQEYLATCGS